jgi:hypothetical protein
MKSISEKFYDLVMKFGQKNGNAMVLSTIEQSFDDGIMLNYSTIDRIEVDDCGSLSFVYNENTNEYATIYEFAEDELERYYNCLLKSFSE